MDDTQLTERVARRIGIAIPHMIYMSQPKMFLFIRIGLPLAIEISNESAFVWGPKLGEHINIVSDFYQIEYVQDNAIDNDFDDCRYVFYLEISFDSDVVAKTVLAIVEEKKECYNVDCTNKATNLCGNRCGARYCSVSCQKNDWKTAHKRWCKSV